MNKAKNEIMTTKRTIYLGGAIFILQNKKNEAIRLNSVCLCCGISSFRVSIYFFIKYYKHFTGVKIGMFLIRFFNSHIQLHLRFLMFLIIRDVKLEVQWRDFVNEKYIVIFVFPFKKISLF